MSEQSKERVRAALRLYQVVIEEASLGELPEDAQEVVDRAEWPGPPVVEETDDGPLGHFPEREEDGTVQELEARLVRILLARHLAESTRRMGDERIHASIRERVVGPQVKIWRRTEDADRRRARELAAELRKQL